MVDQDSVTGMQPAVIAVVDPEHVVFDLEFSISARRESIGFAESRAGDPFGFWELCPVTIRDCNRVGSHLGLDFTQQ